MYSVLTSENVKMHKSEKPRFFSCSDGQLSSWLINLSPEDRQQSFRGPGVPGKRIDENEETHREGCGLSRQWVDDWVSPGYGSDVLTGWDEGISNITYSPAPTKLTHTLSFPRKIHWTLFYFLFRLRDHIGTILPRTGPKAQTRNELANALWPYFLVLSLVTSLSNMNENG